MQRCHDEHITQFIVMFLGEHDQATRTRPRRETRRFYVEAEVRIPIFQVMLIFTGDDAA